MKTRKINGIDYTAISEEIIITPTGKRFKEIIFFEGKGKLEDLDGDGIAKSYKLRCRIPDGCEDIDVMNIKDDCIRPVKVVVDTPNKEALIKK